MQTKLQGMTCKALPTQPLLEQIVRYFIDRFVTRHQLRKWPCLMKELMQSINTTGKP
jgi:hypothetical protein